MSDLITNGALPRDSERTACLGIDPRGGYVRHPPTPHLLNTFITPDSQLFQTVHMGEPNIDSDKYVIAIDGLVKKPYSLTLEQLKLFPSTTFTSFHECYGPPMLEPTRNYWRIGNVRWKGVEMRRLIERAGLEDEGKFVWCEGLDSGTFAGVRADRYQKDVPLEKVLLGEAILAYEMNGKPLERDRGGPVRVIVPGWFGTNSVKWLSRVEVREGRAQGPFTTKFYNERIPEGEVGEGEMRPVWAVQPNSMIVCPGEGERIMGSDGEIEVWGWAWGEGGVERVSVSVDNGVSWIESNVEEKVDFSWQRFGVKMKLEPGKHRLIARATSKGGLMQPMEGRRNHVHAVEMEFIAR
jgi:DMSO/TMAO reductase YedYZ molybdopterin-dependent catalytic subunit